MRLLVSVFAVFLLICTAIGAGFAFLGQRAPVDFEQTHSVSIAAPAEVVWLALTDVSTLVDRYDDIHKVTLLESDERGALRWQVQRGDTSVVTYRRTAVTPNRALSIGIDGGNMGIEGGYRYQLEPMAEGGTLLTARENTSIQDFVLRAAFALAGGRDQVLKAQLAEIKEVSEAQEL